MNTIMQNLSSTTTGSYPSITTLDGSTRLRMAADAKPVRRAAAVAVGTMAPAKVSIVKEAVAVSVLLGVFTAAFWLLITFIRSH